MPRFCEQSDVERALGGAAVLVELLDKDGDGVADVDLVEQCMDAGSNELASYIGVTVDTDQLVKPYPLILVLKAADASAFYAWRYGISGQVCPDQTIQAHDGAIRWATDVGLKRATLVMAPKAALDQPVGVVDQDTIASALTDNNSRTKLSVAAFKLGFR